MVPSGRIRRHVAEKALFEGFLPIYGWGGLGRILGLMHHAQAGGFGGVSGAGRLGESTVDQGHFSIERGCHMHRVGKALACVLHMGKAFKALKLRGIVGGLDLNLHGAAPMSWAIFV